MAQPTNTNGNDNGLTCVISEGTKIEGKFISSENVRLDGSIKGEISISKKLVTGVNSLIDGNVQAQSVALQGKVKGNVIASETLQLLPTSNIEGDIKASSFIVDEGAVYNGALNIGKK